MSGSSIVLDTNIALYLLAGDQKLSSLLFQKKLYLSFISQLELLGFKGITTKQHTEISKFIQACIVIDINEEIKTEVISLRRTQKLKLPDSIILATALYLDLPLITSDTDFKSIEHPQIIIYE
jgi:predicted nucleic acid-binding protein